MTVVSLHAKPNRTLAETALIDAFGERMSEMPGNGAVMIKRDAAVEQIKAGLPTRHVEFWHYTDLRRLLGTPPVHDPAAQSKPLAPLVASSTVVPVLDGRAAGKVKEPDGVTLKQLDGMLSDGTFASALGPKDADDAVGAINTAFVADGCFLDIAAGAAVEAPIEVQNLHAGGQSHTRLPVRVGAGAKVTIVDRQGGAGQALVTSVSHLTVGEGADVTWLIVQEQPSETSHLAQFNAEIGADASLKLFVLNAGGKLVRQEIRVSAAGEGGTFTLRGINLLAGETHTDVTMVLDHAVPRTSSTEVVRNVVTGSARGVFQGRINVHQYAQKTDAKMSCNTLLLSDEAEFSAKPELEIFADDVQCGHGATVTEIDANHLFYLMARGIDEKTARGLLVKAFIAEIIEELEDEPMVEALEALAETWFAEHA